MLEVIICYIETHKSLDEIKQFEFE